MDFESEHGSTKSNSLLNNWDIRLDKKLPVLISLLNDPEAQQKLMKIKNITGKIRLFKSLKTMCWY